MCGIAGIIGNVEDTPSENLVRRMVGAMARRGPDGEGIEQWPGAVLGHRRLAIFDLSEAGRQPMLDAERRVGVVFNGAIYNHADLRSELVARGCRFRSKTDTEVLVHGYQEWGIDTLVRKLRGMFAFGLWDNQRRRLYLVRDRLGVKPLAFAIGRHFVGFSSTARALREAGLAGEIDEEAVLEFLRWGFVGDGRCIYRGVAKLPAATIMEWSDGAVSTRKYWEPTSRLLRDNISFQKSVDETERLFLESVKIRLQADVPVGVLLSSGIDSSLVCWAVKELGSDISAYTISIPGDPSDEADVAKDTAKRLGIKHQILEMAEKDEIDIDNLVSAYAEPFACESALGMLKIASAVSRSATVLLTGDGGDDVFLGYPRHRHMWIAQNLAAHSPSGVKSLWARSKNWFPRVGPLRRAAALFDYTTEGFSAYINAGRRLAEYKGLLGDRLSAVANQADNVVWPVDPRNNMLANLLSWEAQTRFVGEYMTKVDGATMHYALEARSPFLDQDLWGYASSLPFEVRLHGGRLKAVLRELARRRLGGKIARRKKRGFTVPVQRWLTARSSRWAEEIMQDSLLEKEGWIDIRSNYSELERARGNGSVPQYLWYLLVLESWLRKERAISTRPIIASGSGQDSGRRPANSAA